MKVTTSNPIKIDGANIEPIYSSIEDSKEESYRAGDIKISTINPVIVNDKHTSPEDYYSNLGGVTGSAAQQMSQITKNVPSMETQAKAKQKGQFWNKAKGAWEKISNSPAANFALQQLAAYQAQRQGGGQDTFTQQNQQQNEIKDENKPEPMKLGVKIAIGVGAVLVIGLIIYAVASGDSKGKTSK